MGTPRPAAQLSHPAAMPLCLQSPRPPAAAAETANNTVILGTRPEQSSLHHTKLEIKIPVQSHLRASNVFQPELKVTLHWRFHNSNVLVKTHFFPLEPTVAKPWGSHLPWGQLSRRLWGSSVAPINLMLLSFKGSIPPPTPVLCRNHTNECLSSFLLKGKVRSKAA